MNPQNNSLTKVTLRVPGARKVLQALTTAARAAAGMTALWLLASCAPPAGGPSGNLVISLPGAPAGRAAIPSGELAGRIAYTVTLTGPGGTQTRTLAAGQTQTVFNLAPGNWTVAVTALVEDVPVGSGSARVTVTGEPNQHVSLNLDFYDEGDFPPNAVIDGVFTVTDGPSWSAAVSGISGKTGNYIINVIATVTGISGVSTATFGSFAGTVSIRGGSLALGSAGSLLYIGANQKVLLRDVTLIGMNTNTASLVYLDNAGAKLDMHSGAVIKDNNSSGSGGGVYVEGGAFTMSGGAIGGNTAGYGGGVYVLFGGTFAMSGGTIGGNTAGSGGGVYVNTGGTFTKTGGGIIYGDTNNTHAAEDIENTATSGGGHAVYVQSGPKKRNGTAWQGDQIVSSTETGLPD